ncbi:asparaginase [Komagataeibacter saccharivorans]|uniref:asparaginase n=1 Tax=Komagataeibacter saccharivorans TaxID=265959 RepID=UPI000CBE8E08|nr:asparaginase [Komagataeibacter saccharivorans]PMP98232.1 Asparaginase [Komagataeibacter saccharivorans]
MSTARCVSRLLPLALMAAGVLPVMSVPAFAANTTTPAIVAPAALPRVLVLATGGTISGRASARSAIGYDAGAVTGAELIAGVPGVDRLARLRVEQIANIPSQNMNNAVWFRLAERIRQAFAHNEADAVVITHGTDTMEETAFFLDTVLDTPHPVVLTGAMRPGTAISADGPANMYEAVKVATAPQAAGRGVLVVMDDVIHAARWVSKTHTTALQTFLSRNAGPVGFVDPASVRFVTPAQQSGHLGLPADHKLPRVEIIYAHADMDGRQIDDAIRAGARGLVVAGMGDGNVSDDALSALDRAVRAGIVVVRSTRVGDGFVNRDVEVDDDRHGLVASLDLNPAKARILLQLLLADGATAAADIQRTFAAGH